MAAETGREKLWGQAELLPANVLGQGMLCWEMKRSCQSWRAADTGEDGNQAESQIVSKLACLPGALAGGDFPRGGYYT